MIQEQIVSTINQSIADVAKIDKVQCSSDMMQQLASVIKMCQPQVSNMELVDLPPELSDKQLHKLLIQNVKKFKLFMGTMVNPVSIAQLVSYVNAV